MTVSDEARELARKAKAELIRRGRYKGSFADPDATDRKTCKVCVLGALGAADNGNVYLLDPSSAAEEVVIELAEMVGRRPATTDPWTGESIEFDWEMDIDTVANWHDRDTTTDDDVYRLLDAISGDALSKPSELVAQGVG